MRAIILAAGEGKRLYPLTVDRPKCLVEYQGKPILDYQLETFRACGVDDIVIIKGYKADALIRPDVKYVINPDFAKTNMVYTLFCAESYFDDDLIISYGDIIYERSILEAVLKSDADLSTAISLNWRELWERRMSDPLSDAETLKMDWQGKILELGKKPKSYDEIEGQYMGLIKVSRKMAAEMIRFYHSMDPKTIYDGKAYPQMFMTSFLQALIDAGYPLQAVKVTGEWIEVDRVEDLKVPCKL